MPSWFRRWTLNREGAEKEWWPHGWAMDGQTETPVPPTRMETIECDPACKDPIAAPPDPDFGAALLRALFKISIAERCFLALHYVGGLDHGEIAEALSMSEDEVSEQITGILSELRRHLTCEDVGTAKFMLNAEKIQEALSSCLPVPKGLQARVMKYVFGTGTRAPDNHPPGPGDTR